MTTEAGQGDRREYLDDLLDELPEKGLEAVIKAAELALRLFGQTFRVQPKPEPKPEPAPPAPFRSFVAERPHRGFARKGDMLASRHIGSGRGCDIPRQTASATRKGYIGRWYVFCLNNYRDYRNVLMQLSKCRGARFEGAAFCHKAKRIVPDAEVWRIDVTAVYEVMEVQPCSPRPWDGDKDLREVAAKLGMVETTAIAVKGGDQS